MAHHHEHNTKNIGITILLNTVITVAQIIGGIISGSMALLSDAMHNFSDVLALIISYIAKKLYVKENTLNRTFGYKRAEILAAFINSATLIIIAVILIVKSIERYANPQDIHGNIVIYLAALSILLNGLSVLLIKKDSKKSMNIRSAYLHLFTDMLTSIAVLVGGFFIKYLGWNWIDNVLSLGIAAYLIYSSWEIFTASLKIMMQFTPEDIDIKKIVSKINKIEGVKNIHHIHVWKLDEHQIIFEAHIDVNNDIHVSQFEKILLLINNILIKSGIHHSNIQPEYNIVDNKDIINN
ncbi:MAG: cation transporter [Bacteroidetes bacterium]|nr:MAG: cation transporter [Bacteroidota bacterium]